MNIDACFILSAGLGTRMGIIGRELAKPMWPLFNQTLFSATLNYWKSLGFENFYANVHHKSEEMIPYLKSLGVQPVVEPLLLGSGGAFHNLKKQYPDLKKVLSVNCDSFAKKVNLESFQSYLSTESHLLFTVPVLKDEKFNRLIIEKNKLKGIKKSFEDSGVTYSGVGVINLDQLPKSEGVSSFFDTVADYNNKEILVAENVFGDFLDFGTKENYYYSSFKLIENELTDLKELCSIDSFVDAGNNIIYSSKMKDGSDLKNCIVFETKESNKGFKNAIIYKDHVEEI